MTEDAWTFENVMYFDLRVGDYILADPVFGYERVVQAPNAPRLDTLVESKVECVRLQLQRHTIPQLSPDDADREGAKGRPSYRFIVRGAYEPVVKIATVSTDEARAITELQESMAGEP